MPSLLLVRQAVLEELRHTDRHSHRQNCALNIRLISLSVINFCLHFIFSRRVAEAELQEKIVSFLPIFDAFRTLQHIGADEPQGAWLIQFFTWIKK